MSKSVDIDIVEIIKSFFNDSCMFTAYDVSQELRKRLIASNDFDFNIHRHNAVKDQIHNNCINLMNTYNYDRQLCNVGAPTDAFVYYNPSVHNLQNYVPIANYKPAKPAAQSVAKPAVSKPQFSPTNFVGLIATAQKTPVSIVEPDARGTICIPKSCVLSLLDASKGNKFYVHCDKAKVYLNQDSKDSLTSYTVDSSSNVRITANTLLKCGFVNKQHYNVTVEQDCIKIA
jgi:hypothetical protein